MVRHRAIIILLVLGMLVLAACGAGTAVSFSDQAETNPRETPEAFGTEAPALEADASVNETESETPPTVEPVIQEAGKSETEQSIVESDEDTQAEPEEQTEEDAEMIMQMKIGDTAVKTAWEENESVEALKALCADEPLVVEMSMYGGFEQVGSIGTGLPRNDAQTTTEAGDIVLYSGDQIVVFYGSNSWAYTRLGHITDRSAEEMAELLGNGDVTITISMEAAG